MPVNVPNLRQRELLITSVNIKPRRAAYHAMLKRLLGLNEPNSCAVCGQPVDSPVFYDPSDEGKEEPYCNVYHAIHAVGDGTDA